MKKYISPEIEIDNEIMSRSFLESSFEVTVEEDTVKGRIDIESLMNIFR